MTKAEAIKELTRCAEICPSTSLAEACRMAVKALRDDEEKLNCCNCKYSDRMPSVYPCSQCAPRFAAPSNWESKEVDNGKAD